MSGNFQHSTAAILQAVFLQLNQGTDPTLDEDWPIYVTSEPDRPDDVITVSNTANIDFGRSQIDGERQEHYGFQVRIRYTDEELAHAKAASIAECIDKLILNKVVTLGAISYCVHSTSRKSSILDLSYELPTSKRQIKTINATAVISLFAP